MVGGRRKRGRNEITKGGGSKRVDFDDRTRERTRSARGASSSCEYEGTEKHNERQTAMVYITIIIIVISRSKRTGA